MISTKIKFGKIADIQIQAPGLHHCLCIVPSSPETKKTLGATPKHEIFLDFFFFSFYFNDSYLTFSVILLSGVQWSDSTSLCIFQCLSR